jgi:hypothetical protein
MSEASKRLEVEANKRKRLVNIPVIIKFCEYYGLKDIFFKYY